MAKVGAQRAAELTGRSKSTVQRAMKNGKISYEVDANGRRLIDVSELDRAFGLMPQGGERDEAETVQAEIEKATQMLENERLKMRIRMLEDQIETAKAHIEDLKAQRDQWQKQAQQVLLTSQYSQKQAEEYKEKLEAQQRASLARRQQMQEQQRQGQSAGKAGVGNENRKAGPIEQQRNAGIQGLWTKIRGSNAPAKPAATTVAGSSDKAA